MQVVSNRILNSQYFLHISNFYNETYIYILCTFRKQIEKFEKNSIKDVITAYEERINVQDQDGCNVKILNWLKRKRILSSYSSAADIMK